MMKNILALILFSFLIVSCGTKKEMVEETTVVEEAPPVPEPRERNGKKPSVDLDKLIAQLGLTEAQEAEFIAMWEKTGDDMMNVREKYLDDRHALRTNMKKVRDERQAGIKRILTKAQLTKYYEIMDENRKKMGAPPIRRG